MRYRRLDANGDMTFGQGSANFIINTPEAVAQAVGTRLGLDAGEWFLDSTVGLNLDAIRGTHTASRRDVEIRNRILNTQGVDSLATYQSQLDPSTRLFSVEVSINTIYGPTATSTTVQL